MSTVHFLLHVTMFGRYHTHSALRSVTPFCVCVRRLKAFSSPVMHYLLYTNSGLLILCIVHHLFFSIHMAVFPFSVKSVLCRLRLFVCFLFFSFILCHACDPVVQWSTIPACPSLMSCFFFFKQGQYRRDKFFEKQKSSMFVYVFCTFVSGLVMLFFG